MDVICGVIRRVIDALSLGTIHRGYAVDTRSVHFDTTNNSIQELRDAAEMLRARVFRFMNQVVSVRISIRYPEYQRISIEEEVSTKIKRYQ